MILFIVTVNILISLIYRDQQLLMSIIYRDHPIIIPPNK